MSYSRWGGSRWYTFWCVQNEKTETRDTAIFEICAVVSFTAKELRDDKYKCLNIVKEKENKATKYIVSEEEINELGVYMDFFLKEVNNEYGKQKKGI